MNIELTKTQQTVLDWVVKGATNKQIAKRLNCAESTIKAHVGNILQKYGARNRQQLILSVLRGAEPGSIPDSIPNDAEPFGWVHLHGDRVVGVMFTKKAPNPKWEPLYIKRNQSGHETR